MGNLQEGSEAQDTSDGSAADGDLAGTGLHGGRLGGDNTASAHGGLDGGSGGGGVAVESWSVGDAQDSVWWANVAYQAWQLTMVLVVTGTLTVTGQSVMVRVVGCQAC